MISKYNIPLLEGWTTPSPSAWQELTSAISFLFWAIQFSLHFNATQNSQQLNCQIRQIIPKFQIL